MDWLLLLSSLLLIAARVSSRCTILPTHADDDVIPKRFQETKKMAIRWGQDNTTARCNEGYMFYIIHKGVNSFFVEDEIIRCIARPTHTNRDNEWRLPGGYTFDSDDKITCVHGHHKDHSNCPLTLNNQKIYVPNSDVFRCPNGNVTVTSSRGNEQVPWLKCEDVEWNFGDNRPIPASEAPIVQCEEAIIPPTGCSLPNSNSSQHMLSTLTHFAPIVENNTLTCPGIMKFHIVKDGKTILNKETVKFKCENGTYTSSKFSLSEEDLVTCVDDTMPAGNSTETETISTINGCSVGVAKNESITGLFPSISTPLLSADKLYCKAGSYLYVTRDDSIGYIVKDSFTCRDQLFETSSGTFKINKKDSVTCVVIRNITQYAGCEVIIDDQMVTIVKEMQCPTGYEALVSDELKFPEGHRFKCVNGSLKDCGKYIKKPEIKCIRKNELCPAIPQFTPSPALPSPFNVSHSPVVKANTHINCPAGRRMLVSRPGNVAFIIDEDLHCSNTKWKTLSGYQIRKEDTIICVPVSLRNHESCEMHVDGQRVYVVSKISCPGDTTLQITNIQYKKGEHIACKNGSLQICDATFIHRNPTAKCVDPKEETATTQVTRVIRDVNS